jgi:glycosyltransferase involved in cell wall biosynthesis
LVRGTAGANVRVLTPLFSVIVPTLNVESAIRSCLESIAGQTFADYQVVLVDGGSTDKTLEVVATFRTTLGPRLLLQAGADDGVYDAMNRGVGLAAGEWLLFLGADDILHGPDTLENVAALLRAGSRADLVYGDVLLRGTGERYGGEFDVDRLLLEKNLCHQSVFYRRELFEKLGPYNLRYRIWADWDFNIRCFEHPALVTRHLAVVVADYNDAGGLSQQEDEVLKKLLPVFYIAATPPTFVAKVKDRLRALLGREQR